MCIRFELEILFVNFGFSCQLNSLDPFAVMDDYEVSLPHGYPDHAHRGFEVVSGNFPCF